MSPINSRVIDEKGKVAYIIHRVEDVTGFVHERLSGKNAPSDATALSRMSSELFNRGHEIEEANRRLRASSRTSTGWTR